jgi:hypothetical protein
MIPESYFSDAESGQILRALVVTLLLIGITVAPAVQFHREFRGRPEEIERVKADLMLASKLEAGEFPVVKLTPQDALLIRRPLAE